LIYPTPIRSQSSSSPVKSHGSRLSNGSSRRPSTTITPRSDVKREELTTPRRSARVQGSDVTTTQSVSMSDSMGAVQGSDVTATQSVSMSDSMGAVQGLDVTATQSVSMSDSMGAVQGSNVTATRCVSMSESMGAVQGPYETTTRCVRMSTSGGAVQSSKEVKPKGNMGNKLKAPPLEPTRYGTRQRKSVEHLEP
jgi:uncharacterized protein (DUF697 family)